MKSAKNSRKSEAAGTALVAALIGSHFAEEAEAAGFGRGEHDWLRNLTFCAGQDRFGETDRFARHSGHETAARDDGSHLFGASDAHGSHGLSFGHANEHASFLRSSISGRGHENHFGTEDRAFVRGGRGARPHHEERADAPTKDERTGGHTHTDDGSTGGTTTNAGGTGDPAPSTGGHTHSGTTTDPAPSSPTPTTGGHTHSGTTTDTTTGGSSPIPLPTDPLVHAEHMASLNLVPVSAATHVAVNNGSWFDPNTWANGQVPGDGAKVLIPQGITVDYDGESAASIFTVRVDGKLDFATDVDTFMEVDTFVVTSSGTLTIGTEGNPVDPNVKAVISFADNGPINVAWDPMLLSRGLISHGAVDIHGSEKDTFLKVAVDPMKGDTTLTLEGPPDGWQVGDKLVLTGTHLVSTKGTPLNAPITAQTQDEELVITAINGNVITLDRPLTYDHEGARSDLKAFVANYSRNVVFENEGGETTDVHERGHVMLMNSDVVVKYAEFDELGRTDKSVASFDVLKLSSVASDSNIRGRYSLHIHRAGVDDLQDPAIVEGNAVWGSPGWGFVHHDSNAIFSDNAAYDVFGAAFVAETGNETGRWDHNIAIKSLGVNHLTKTGSDVNSFDLGRTGTGFWFQGRLVDAVDNVAAGVPSGAGFTYFHRGADQFHIPIDPNSSPTSDALRYLDSVKSNSPNISIFLNNESVATETGLEIIKANPVQDSDLRSLIDNFLAWEVKKGVHLEYTGHYTLRDLDVVASDSAGIAINQTIGLDLWKNVFDVVVNGANIEGFYTGVRQAKSAIGGQFDYMNNVDQWEYVYIDTSVKGAAVAFTNRTAGDKFLTADDLTDGRLFYNSAFAETFITQANGVFNLRGTKTDSIGQTSGYKSWDPDYINTKELRGSIEENGYWTTADGRRVALIEEYYSDRATGDVIKVGVFVEIPSRYVLKAGGFTRITPVNNGVLDLNSKAPDAVDDTASVTQGNKVVIDLLANDSDPDGDAIKLDGIFSQHGHVVDNGDGTVTYFADSNFSGDDVFYYFVQDTNGDISKAQVTVTVDI